MGARGPAPEPTESKIARGETRPSRVNFEAPAPPPGDLVMPRGMIDGAQSVWRRVVKAMRGTGVLTPADVDLLRGYCEAVVSYQRNMKLLADSGGSPLIRGSQGRGLIVNPVTRMARWDLETIRLLARDLGLSPAARSNLRIDMGASLGEMEDILGPPPRLRVVGGTDEE